MKLQKMKKWLSFICAGTLSFTLLPFHNAVALAEDWKANTSKPIAMRESDVSVKKNGNLLTGDFNNDGAVTSDDVAILKQAITDGSAANMGQADVNGDGTLDDNDTSLLSAYAAGEVTYFPVGNIYTADAAYVTRAEWIHTLVDAFEMGVDDESTMEECFTDIAGTSYENDINLAANFGVFDIDSETFAPDDYVSREFMAHTMNYCLGFADDNTPTFTDVDDVYYVGDAQVAVERGWLSLEGTEFCPDMYVVQEEVNAALADMQQIFDESAIDGNTEPKIVTDVSVIAIEETAQATMSGNSVTITGSSKTVAEGDTISFPLEDNLVVRKVITASKDEESGTLYLETEMPEEEMVDEVNASGYAYIDYDNIEMLTDDVDLVITEEEEEVPMTKELAKSPTDVPLYGWGTSGTIKVNTKKLSFSSKPINVGGGKLTISGGLTKLNVPYNIDMKGLSVNKLKVGVNADMNLKANLVTEMSAASGEIPFMKIPVITSGVADIVVTASISISVKGEITITYSCGVDGSVAYSKKNGWRFEKNFHSKGFTIEASVEEKIGIKLAVQLKSCTKKLGEVYFSFGEQGKAKAVRHSDGFTCMDITAHLYAEFGLNFSLPKYKKTWTLIDAKNSPIYINAHYDNDKKVKSCTYGKTSSTPPYIGSTTSDGGKVNSKGRVVYTGKSGNIKRAKGTKSTTWTSSYTAYTQKFAELTPPTEINEDTTLTEDMTCSYGLIINADLDLNGHTLTVKGDVKHNSGDINFNKGTMTVSGDYISDTSDYWFVMYMNYKEDTFIVDGNVDIGRSTGGGHIEAIAGTCEFKGDFYCYDSYQASDLHKTIFSGTKDQTIYGKDANTSFNIVEIKNSDNRKILVESNFLVQKATTCDGNNLNLSRSDNVSSDIPTIKLSACSVENLTIDGDCTLSELNYTGKNVTVNGNVSIAKGRTINMNGCTWVNHGNLTFDADLDSNNSKFYISGGNLTVNGDITNSSYYGLIMTNKKDTVTATGDFLVKKYMNSENLTNGILYVGGDIYATDEIFASENHRIILTGKEDQNLYMEGTDSYIHYLKIENAGSRKFTVDGYFRSEIIDCGEESLNLITNDIPGNVGSISFGTLTCSDLNIEGDVNFYHNNTFKGKTININGSCTLQDWGDAVFDIGDAVMTVKKNMIENEGYYDDEYVKVGGGKLIVEGNYQQNSGVLHITSGTVSVAGDAAFNGSLIMDKEDSLLTIAGDMDNDLQSYTKLTAGKLELAGNMTSTSGYLYSSDPFQVILTGKEDQTLKLDPIESSDWVGFANLEVQNSDTRKLILQNRLSAGNVTCDGKAIQITSNGGAINKMKLRCPIHITGDVIVRGDASYNTVDLNGNEMTIDGNLYQYGCIIQPNTGKLIISKNYLMVSDEDSAVYGTSSGILSMTNAGDYVCVNGDFVTNTTQNHKKYLTAGLLEIQGDFHQMADGTTFAFPASGTHQVLLSGSEKQNVTFDSYSDSHFNILALNQPESQYVFNENPCWNEQISGSDIVVGTTTAETGQTTTETTATTTVNSTGTAKETTTGESTASAAQTTDEITTTESSEASEETTTTAETTTASTSSETVSIVLSANETLTETITVGKTIQLKLPDDMQAVSWVSSKPEIVTVDSNGVCQVLGEGESLIIATDSNAAIYMIQIQGEASTSNLEVTLKEPGFYLSVDDRPFVPSNLMTVLDNGEDVTDQITFAYASPQEAYSAEENCNALLLQAYYHDTALTETPRVYIAMKGDTDMDGNVTLSDAYQTLMYNSMRAINNTSYRISNSSDDVLEAFVLFLSDVDMECSEPENISLQDAYNILMYNSMIAINTPKTWPEIIPSLYELEQSYWYTKK